MEVSNGWEENRIGVIMSAAEDDFSLIVLQCKVEEFHFCSERNLGSSSVSSTTKYPCPRIRMQDPADQYSELIQFYLFNLCIYCAWHALISCAFPALVLLGQHVKVFYFSWSRTKTKGWEYINWYRREGNL